MIKSASSSFDPCGGGTNSNCVTWQGDDILCLGIEKGQTLSESVKKVADEVCSLKDTLDLSDLDLKCVFDLCVSCPEPEKTLKTVLELIITKVCSLEDIIDSLDVSSATGTDPVLTLASCFQYTDVDGDLVVELPHSQYTKRIANQVCQILLTLSSLQDDVDNLENTVNDLQEQVNNLETNIPDVTSDCLYVGTKSIDDAWDLLDQAFCQLRTAVGLTTDINLAIGRQCSGLNTELGSEPGWQNSPSNLSQSIGNLWIAFCNMRDRVTLIEDNCCAITCSDVGIGFLIILNDARDEATIKFTSGAGTSLPSGFEDQGSTMTITDESGNTLEFNIEVSNGGEDTLTLTGLNTQDDYSFSLTAVVGSDSLSCEKCITKTAVYNASTCCEISASGDGCAVITYEDGGPVAVVSISTTTTTSTSSTTTTTTTSGS